MVAAAASEAMDSHQLPRRPHKPVSFPNSGSVRVLKEPRVISSLPVVEKKDMAMSAEEMGMEGRQAKHLPEPPIPAAPLPSPTPYPSYPGPSPTPSAIHGLKPKSLPYHPSPIPYHPTPLPYNPSPAPYHHPVPPHHTPYIPHGPTPPYHGPTHAPHGPTHAPHHAPPHPKVKLFHTLYGYKI